MLRIRHVTSRVAERLKQRENERLRIARELHDTLLQSIHGLMLRFHFAMEALSTDDPARPALLIALERAGALILEDAVEYKICEEKIASRITYPEMLARMAQELNRGESVNIQVSEEGSRRGIRSDIQSEVGSILRECLTNALTHAKATQIDVEVLYHRRSLRLLCKDNGAGIPASVVRQGGKKGHWRMKGMKERAQSYQRSSRNLEHSGTRYGDRSRDGGRNRICTGFALENASFHLHETSSRMRREVSRNEE